MTKDVLTHSADGTVSSLAEICLESSLKYLESSHLRKENTFLPEDICEALIRKKLKTGSCNDDFVATYFTDIQTSRITKVHVSGADLTDSGLGMLSVHPLREVDVSNCESVSEKAIMSLVNCKNTLTSLNLGNCSRINAFTELQQLTRLKSLDVSQTLLDQRDLECLSTLVHLRSLNVSTTEITSLEPVQTMSLLTNLDLSKCTLLESIEPLKTLKGTLQWLSLYNCRGLFFSLNLIETLEELTQLQHLDLSRGDPDEPIRMQSFLECEQIMADKDFLERLLPSLPALTWLDLSGNTKFSPGDLQLFWNCFPQKLNFLGLFMTEMCSFPAIPADKVSGNSDAKQVVLSVRMYNHRPTFLLQAMRALFGIIREDREFGLNKDLMCSAVVEAMESHPKESNIQLAGSASLYHLSRDDDDENPQRMLSAELKRRVIEVTISAMEKHVLESQLQRNCCLTLCNFRIPNEITCGYKRILGVLLQTAMEHKNDLIQRIAIGLCNMLVCQVQDSQKIVVGRDLEGVKKILQIMRHKMEHNPDRGGVLECCWSALWNVTDETPENCELFISHGGIKLFMDCKWKLGDQRDLVRNMLGLMGNVAEVAELRSQLMIIAHIFYDLLQTEGQLEVTYNAAGIICHLAFDGPDNWTNHKVSRDQALDRLVETISKWNINTTRQMSYRSFAPILKLISGCDSPAIHYWATWALANLCNVDPEKYCKLVSDEGGVELLRGLSENSRTSSKVKELVDMTLEQCRQQVDNA